MEQTITWLGHGSWRMADTDDLIQQVAVRCPQVCVNVLEPGGSIAV